MSTGRTKRRRVPAIGAISSLLLLCAAVVHSQTTGNLEGIVTDQGGAPLPGVAIALTSPNLQGARSATTGADGRYRFPGVPPGSYLVRASLEGFGAVEKKATVTLDATVAVTLQLNLSTTAEVTVTGEAPLIDATSTTAGSSYAGKVIGQLPLASRNYADVVFTQPGAQADNGETQGRSLAISIYGSTSAENSFLIDGVNTTSVIKGVQGKDINNEFVQEVEVKTGGYQAEYGRNTGGVINVITKSGGNEFHGALFGYYNSTGMKASTDFVSTPNYSESGDAQAQFLGVLVVDNRQETGADLGGFALKDRIWFFVAYDRVRTNQSTTPTSGPVEGGVFPTAFVENKYAGKLTFNITSGTSLVGSYFSDRETESGALSVPQSINPTTYEGRIDTGGPDYGAQLNQLFGSSGLLTLQYGHHSERYETKPVDRDEQLVYDYTPLVFGASGLDFYGGYGSVFGPIQNNNSTRNSYAAMLTQYLGNHEVKAGGDYQKDVTRGSTYWTGLSAVGIHPCTPDLTPLCDPNAPLYTNGDGNTTQVFYEHDFYTANGTDLTPLRESPFSVPTTRWSAFLQDEWRVTPRLTVNLGVRYDAESVLRGNGAPAFSLTGQWAPRVGVSWDVVGNGTSKLYASAGRFYYAMPTDLAVRVYTANTFVQTYNYSTTSLAQGPAMPIPQLLSVGSYEGEPVDPGLKEYYQDELTIGFEKAIDTTLSVGLKGTYRTLGRAIEDRCDLDPATAPFGSSCALANPGSRGPASLGLYGVCDGSANPTDPTAGQCGLNGVPMPDAKRIFRGIEVLLRKQISNALWIQASYLYSSLEGNYSGAVREGSGQTDPGINADFDYYQLAKNAYGRLELHRPSQARIDGVYNAPFGLSVGLQFYVRSGTPYTRGGYLNQYYNQELYLDPRGSSGRTPTDTEMNASLAYSLVLGPVTVTPQVLIFNMFNNQTPTAYNIQFNPNGSFVQDPTSPFYGQAGVQPGQPGTDGTVCAGPVPCSDNPNFLKITARTNPRSFRAVLKVSF
jgi:hypothetical protein